MKTRFNNFSYSYFLIIIFFIIAPFSLTANNNFLESDPLSVEEAFQIEFLVISPNETIVRWKINNSYYLYKKKITFSSNDYFIYDIILPTAQIKEDPYFGKTEVYYEILEAKLIIEPKTKKNTSRIISIEYQGCWEGGVCYPVEKTFIKL
tara:strand:+ start:956 stop:1405 length:450 start_codon:yes stop_codon:yes gene_type:complete